MTKLSKIMLLRRRSTLFTRSTEAWVGQGSGVRGQGLWSGVSTPCVGVGNSWVGVLGLRPIRSMTLTGPLSPKTIPMQELSNDYIFQARWYPFRLFMNPNLTQIIPSSSKRFQDTRGFLHKLGLVTECDETLRNHIRAEGKDTGQGLRYNNRWCYDGRWIKSEMQSFVDNEILSGLKRQRDPFLTPKALENWKTVIILRSIQDLASQHVVNLTQINLQKFF